MGEFSKRLKSHGKPSGERRWIYLPYDQLSSAMGLLARENPKELGAVLLENPWKASRRPYQKQKLAWILANQRHFALELAEAGVAVRYETVEGPYREGLRRVAEEVGPLSMMEPAERELRDDLRPLLDKGLLKWTEHEGWLTTPEQFRKSQKKTPPWRMDAFYRYVRRRTGVLMEDGKPRGGKFSFDAENREKWRGDPPAPPLPRLEVDPIKAEVGELIEKHFGRHPGKLSLESLPATLAEAEIWWDWVCRECLEHFGPYEDAMSTASTNLFHTRLSPLLNLHRILPARVLEDVLGQDLPLPSLEGFVRQILGWREFMRHVHRETDGFRHLPDADPPVRPTPGDGGYEAWSGEVWTRDAAEEEPDGGAAPSFLDADRPVPPAFWGRESGLRCLDVVVESVWEEAYSHHITRLMVLSNLATLLDLSPRDVTDWFWVAYADAYDWVVEPNVLGMGMFALGDLFTTKPYVSGAAYIDRMGDYCADCAFDPKNDCPITRLYWAFLARHLDRLEDNPRLRMILASLGKRSAEKRKQDRKVFERLSLLLSEGKPASPSSLY